MISLYQYTAYNNPEGTRRIIQKYGHYPWLATERADYSKLNAQALAQLVQKYGDSARADIATIHPDFDLIVSNYQVPQIIDQKEKIIDITPKHVNACGCNSNYSNANGCGCNMNNLNKNACNCVGHKYSNADGNTAPAVAPGTYFTISTNTLLLLSVAVVGTALLLKMNGK